MFVACRVRYSSLQGTTTWAIIDFKLNSSIDERYKNSHKGVFVFRFDDEKEVSTLFDEVWEENISSESVALQLYLPEIVSVLCDGMLSSSWANKKKSAKAVIKLAEVLGELLAPFVQELLKCLLKEIPGRIWEGKEVVLDSTAAICKACHNTISPGDPIGPDVLITAVSVACTKKRQSYRKAAFGCLEQVFLA
eukprot:Gb_39359 [translate_table: standard]